MSNQIVPLNYFQSRHAQPLPGNVQSILLDKNAPPSSSRAWAATQTLGDPNTALKPRSQVAVQNGYEHPKTWNVGEYIEYYFDKTWKYSPFHMLFNLIDGKGILDPRSKIGKVNQLFDKDFDAEKKKMVDAMMELYKDSLQQLPDDDPVKKVALGKANEGEKRLQLAIVYRNIMEGPWKGQVAGFDMHVKQRYNPNPEIKIGGWIGEIEDAEAKYADNRYTFSFSTGALRRLNLNATKGPDATSSIMAGHPAAESGGGLYIVGDLKRPRSIPEQIVELKDLEGKMRKKLEDYVESFREPMREASLAEIIVGALGDIINNLAPGIGAVEALTKGDMERFATELGLDVATLLTPGGRALVSALKRGMKLQDVVQALGKGTREHLYPIVSSILAPTPPHPDVVYRNGGRGLEAVKDFAYNRYQDAKQAALEYATGPVELQATRATSYTNTTDRIVQRATDQRYNPPLSRNQDGDLLPAQLFGFAYNQPPPAGSYGESEQPVPQKTESQARAPDRQLQGPPAAGRQPWEPRQRSGRWDALSSSSR